MDPAQLLSRTTLLVALAVLALLAFALAVVITRREGSAAEFERRRALLEPDERLFYEALREAVADRAVVLVKVRAAAVLQPRAGTPRRRRRRAERRLSGRQFDYLLCAPGDMRPLAAVELGHDRRYRPDPVLPAACESAGLGLVHVEAEGDHSAERLGAELRPWLERPMAAAGEVRPDGRREPILDLPED